ncbi:YaaL family protein [Lactobacillus sp. LL6]|uniref:YaaL family protein n=1 Tax=Lactobacillus sp. LL6 TaxID=2596827 RepID=UPI0011871575|nr:YaaL family protein [Lactobacillus sp. LL6]TSO25896.1 DUF2508 family protein [Lactobacillus sp. LL6]
MAKRNKIKEEGDKRLITLVEKLQNEIALQKDLDQTTLDMSDDNVVASKILRAKYTFLYNEARHRHTKFSGITNAITQ